MPTLGCTKDDLDTPALCLDLDLLESNIRTVAEQCRRKGVQWRPHAKGHKTPAVAQMEVAAGANGVTCAKLGEAEVMADGGIRDLLVANLVVGPQKVARLVELRHKADVIVCVDHVDQVDPISDAMIAAGRRVRLLIEVDIGLGRVGVLPGEPLLELARHISLLYGVELAGIMGYEGHLLAIADQAEKTTKIREALGLLVAQKEMLEKSGIPLRHCLPCGYRPVLDCDRAARHH